MKAQFMHRALTVLTLTLFSLTFPSCLVSDNVLDKEKEVYPTLVLIDADYTYRTKDSAPINFKCSRMEFFSQSDKIALTNADFKQTAEDGTVDVSGTAKSIDIDRKANVTQMSGGARITLKNGEEVSAEELNWNQKNNQIRASGKVSIDWDNMNLEAEYFEGNLKTGVFSLVGKAQGTIKEKSSEEPLPDTHTSTDLTGEVTK